MDDREQEYEQPALDSRELKPWSWTVALAIAVVLLGFYAVMVWGGLEAIGSVRAG
jgi:hypothetical protein